MPTTDKFFAINIRKYLALGDDDDEAGEPALVKLLSGFSCPTPCLHILLPSSEKIMQMAGRRLPGKTLLNWLG